MKADISERVGTLEDEVRAMESMVDAQTRRLWGEIQNLQAEVKELRKHNGNRATKSAREW